MLRKVLSAAVTVLAFSVAILLFFNSRSEGTTSAVRSGHLRSSAPSISVAGENFHQDELWIEVHGEGRDHRSLMNVGIPGEGLLLAVANSDRDAIDEFGHEDAATDDSHWHKPLLPVNS